MHLGYVLKKFPRLSETFILNEILELERQGVEVTVLSLHRPDDTRYHEKLARLRAPIIYLPARTGADVRNQLSANLDTLTVRRDAIWEEAQALLREGDEDVWSTLRWGLEISQLAKQRGIDRLHAHFASVASRVASAAHAFSGLPFSFTSHAKDIYQDSVRRDAYARLVGNAEFVVTVCESNRRYIETKLLNGRHPGRVRTLYNGIDLEEFVHRPQARLPGLVLGVGRLIEKKGFRYLIDAVGQLLAAGEDITCVIAGDGPDRESLMMRVRELNTDRITLLGARSHHEVLALMQEATVFALPCVIGKDGNRDALPTVLLEAMAVGLPVVTTPVVGNEEIVDGGNAGILVPERDVDALSRALHDLLTHRNQRDTLAQAAQERVAVLFDLGRNVATLRSWFAAGERVGSKQS